MTYHLTTFTMDTSDGDVIEWKGGSALLDFIYGNGTVREDLQRTGKLAARPDLVAEAELVAEIANNERRMAELERRLNES